MNGMQGKEDTDGEGDGRVELVDPCVDEDTVESVNQEVDPVLDFGVGHEEA